ncbi:hypothetical protein BGZ46_009219 [Entomortierella lignicola]|nr:hypothetical protein BGZ46_009219 [Entomortierella lignicola]
MSAPNPLLVPEILSLVACHVSEGCLPNCARVSKFWHRVFACHIWYDVTIDIFQACPTLDEMHTYRSLIKKLTYKCVPMHKDLMLVCPNLESLTLPVYHFKNANDPMNSWGMQDLLAMIRAHNQISSLDLIFGIDCDSTSIWRLTSELENLKNLSIRGLPILQEGFEYFSGTCTRLRTISLEGYQFSHDGHLGQVTFPQMQHIKLSTYKQSLPSNDLDFIRRCPDLCELVWCNLSGQDPRLSEEFHQLTIERTWPNLESLSIDNHCLEDDRLAGIFRNMKKISTLRFGEGFGPLSFIELRRHFATVKELGLASCDMITSEMVQEILSSCPHLEKFEAPRIHANSITKGRPWVCTKLNQLSVCIVMDPSTADQDQPLVFERLSRLTQLVILNLNASLPSRSYEEYRDYQTDPFTGVILLPWRESIDLRLEKGLGKLWRLKLLREFKFKGTTQNIGEEEVDWMSEQWEFLESITGLLNSDRKMNEALADRFRKYGVLV